MAVIDNKVWSEVMTSVELKLLPMLRNGDYDEVDEYFEELIVKLHKSIPDKMRISYGITYVVKTLAKELYQFFETQGISTYDVAMSIYENMPTFRTKTIGLGLISHIGVMDVEKVLPIFEHAATHKFWEVREFAQMYIKKITKKNPERIQKFLMKLAISEDENKRRYASEALRPVTENKWINDEPEFSLKVLRLLFKEKEEYPRNSVGNNLSDLSRKQPELVFNIIEELMSYGDPNANLIAHRASRNLIMKDQDRIMNLLGIDYYKYKTKIYKR